MNVVFVKSDHFVSSKERMRQYYEKYWMENPEEWNKVLATTIDGVRELKGLPTGPGTWRIVPKKENKYGGSKTR